LNKGCVDGRARSCNPTGDPKLREHGIEAEPASVFYGILYADAIPDRRLKFPVPRQEFPVRVHRECGS
jgi:hypothetical protein